MSTWSPGFSTPTLLSRSEAGNAVSTSFSAITSACRPSPEITFGSLRRWLSRISPGKRSTSVSLPAAAATSRSEPSGAASTGTFFTSTSSAVSAERTDTARAATTTCTWGAAAAGAPLAWAPYFVSVM